MGSIDGWVDPEIKAMQDMIHGAVDASFEDRNRAKEGMLLERKARVHFHPVARTFIQSWCRRASL